MLEAGEVKNRGLKELCSRQEDEIDSLSYELDSLQKEFNEYRNTPLYKLIWQRFKERRNKRHKKK